MAHQEYNVTEEFERMVAEYTGAPYAIALDNASNALFLALYYEDVAGKNVWIPRRTYMSVPCAIIQAGGYPKFYADDGKTTLTGAYELGGTKVWDSALRFTVGMYQKDTHMCLSFTGPYKHLKLSKGGMILTDDPLANAWFRRARFSGRNERSYHDDHFDLLGWNFYMLPEIATRGVQLMRQFYHHDGTPNENPDRTLPYPDLSEYPIYTDPDTYTIKPKAHMASLKKKGHLKL
jgi:hypothetical protein